MTKAQRAMVPSSSVDPPGSPSSSTVSTAMYVPLPTAQPITRVTSAIQHAQAALNSPREYYHETKTARSTARSAIGDEIDDEDEEEYDESMDPELIRIRRGVKQLEKTGHYPADDVAHTHANYVSQWLNHPTVDVESSHRMLHGVRIPTLEEEENVKNSPGFVRRAVRKKHEDEWLVLSEGGRKNQI